ncbi:hypothetical protein ACGF5C_21905 [Micromonospora sp. NPDC047620]
MPSRLRTWRGMVTSVGVDFTVTGPPELVDAIRALGDLCRRAT